HGQGGTGREVDRADEVQLGEPAVGDGDGDGVPDRLLVVGAYADRGVVLVPADAVTEARGVERHQPGLDGVVIDVLGGGGGTFRLQRVVAAADRRIARRLVRRVAHLLVAEDGGGADVQGEDEECSHREDKGGLDEGRTAAAKLHFHEPTPNGARAAFASSAPINSSGSPG